MIATIPTPAPPTAPRPTCCILCGALSQFIGVLTPSDEPRRMILYGLRGGHPLNGHTIARIDDLLA